MPGLARVTATHGSSRRGSDSPGKSGKSGGARESCKNLDGSNISFEVCCGADPPVSAVVRSGRNALMPGQLHRYLAGAGYDSQLTAVRFRPTRRRTFSKRSTEILGQWPFRRPCLRQLLANVRRGSLGWRKSGRSRTAADRIGRVFLSQSRVRGLVVRASRAGLRSRSG
jgi:hypothetical protein